MQIVAAAISPLISPGTRRQLVLNGTVQKPSKTFRKEQACTASRYVLCEQEDSALAALRGERAVP